MVRNYLCGNIAGWQQPLRGEALSLKTSAAGRTLAEVEPKCELRAVGGTGRSLAEYYCAALDWRHFEAKKLMGADCT